MTNSNFIVSPAQFAFIKKLRVFIPISDLTEQKQVWSFSLLNKWSKKAGYSVVPAWITTKDRRVSCGNYRCGELSALDSEITINSVKRGRPAGATNKKNTEAKTVKIASAKTTVSTVVAVSPSVRMDTANAMHSTESVSLARSVSNGESESFVPANDPNYVNWGYHSEIKDIIAKRIFAPVFITGLSGNGKTTMVEQVCAQLKRECIRVNFTAQTDEDELIGGFRLINGETKFVSGPVLVAMERGAVLLLDEIDLGGHLIMCLQSVLEGKGKYIPKIGKYVRPAAGFTVFATANTKGRGDSDGRFIGTNLMNEAFLERFDFTYEQDYASNAVEKKILTKYAESVGVTDDAFVTNLVSWADIIRKSFKQSIVSEIITTRRLLHIIKAFSIFGDKMKSIERCVARFDDETKQSFLQFYTKVDADCVLHAGTIVEGVTDSIEAKIGH